MPLPRRHTLKNWHVLASSCNGLLVPSCNIVCVILHIVTSSRLNPPDKPTRSPTNTQMPVNATETRPGRGGGGLASKLFNKFDSDRKYDPFLDTDPVIQDSKEGMEALLSMCNAVEINSLFGALGFVVPCPRNAKEQQV